MSIDQEADDEHSRDWWTKYFWSYERLIDSTKAEKSINNDRFLVAPANASFNTPSKSISKTSKIVQKLSPKSVTNLHRIGKTADTNVNGSPSQCTVASTAICQVCENSICK